MKRDGVPSGRRFSGSGWSRCAAYARNPARQEAGLAGSLDHPNVIVVFDLGGHEGAGGDAQTLRERLGEGSRAAGDGAGLGDAAKISKSFLPVGVVGSAALEARRGAAVEVALADGVVVRLPPGTDPRYLADLLRALR